MFSQKKQRPICNYFLSPAGCKKGANCNMHHPKNKDKYQQDTTGGGQPQQFGGQQNFTTPVYSNGLAHQPGGAGPRPQGPGGYTSKRPCNYGVGCRYKGTTCTFFHPDQDPQNLPTGVGGGQAWAAPGTGPGQSSTPCKFLVEQGKCEKVKCNFMHKLPSSEISIKLLNEPN